MVAVGGDGTVNEVVNGFADEQGQPLGAPATLGVVERGTGGDFIRTHGIPKKVEGALRVLAEGRPRRIDVGRMTCQARRRGRADAPLRQPRVVRADRRRGDARQRLRQEARRHGRLPVGDVTAFAAWKNVRFHIELDGEARDMVANNVICMNGRQLGGGIKIAPKAEPDDGLFDVVVIGDVGKAALARNVHRMYLGTLEKDPRVSCGARPGSRSPRSSRSRSRSTASCRAPPRCASRSCPACSTCCVPA